MMIQHCQVQVMMEHHGPGPVQVMMVIHGQALVLMIQNGQAPALMIQHGQAQALVLMIKHGQAQEMMDGQGQVMMIQHGQAQVMMIRHGQAQVMMDGQHHMTMTMMTLIKRQTQMMIIHVKDQLLQQVNQHVRKENQTVGVQV